MNWDGECKSGLASGNGTLVVSLKNGKTERYVGQMNEGTLGGQGSYTDQGGYTRTGQFSYGALYYGKRFNPDNALVFEGGFYASGSYKMGKVYFPDGGYVDGGFIDKASAINRTTGQGIEHGVVKNVSGVEIGLFVEGKHLKNGAEYRTALMNYLNAKTQAAQKEMAKMEVENARLSAEQKAKNDRETAAAWAQVANTAATTLKKGTAAQIAFEALANNGDGSQVQPSSARTSASSRSALPNDANDSAKTMNENTCVYPTFKMYLSARANGVYKFVRSSSGHQPVRQENIDNATN